MTALLDLTIRVSIIVGSALAAVALLRNRAAALRHWLLAVAIVCAAAAPAIAPFAPAWHVSRAGSTPDPGRITIDVTTTYGAPAAPTAAPRLPSPRQRDAAAPADRTLGAIWLAGCLLSLGVLATGLGRLWWIAARSTRVVCGPWHEQLVALSARHALSRRVALLQSDRPALLVTWGVLRPAIILPRDAPRWDADRIRVVLSHELAHVARSDWLVQMVAELLRSVHWFNPVVWVAAARLRRESEHACDDIVLESGIDASTYAAELLTLARAARRHDGLLPAQAIVRPSSLQRRVSAMLNTRTARAPVRRATRITAAAGVAAVALAVAGFAGAQQTMLSGTIVDPMGRGVADATLVLTSPDNGAKHEVRSDASGNFHFVALPSGDYTLSTALPGFEPLSGTITLNGASVQRRLTLQLARVQEMITVRNAPPPPPPAPPPPAPPAPAGAEGRPAPPPPPASLAERLAKHRQMRQEAAARCAQSAAGGCLQPPIKIKDVKPVFPPSLIGASAPQDVELQGSIGLDGFVHDLQVVGTVPPGVADAAIVAVSQWQFEPTLLDGQPIETAITIHCRFAPAH